MTFSLFAAFPPIPGYCLFSQLNYNVNLILILPKSTLPRPSATPAFAARKNRFLKGEQGLPASGGVVWSPRESPPEATVSAAPSPEDRDNQIPSI
jgi:hypothetical protein